VVEARRSRHEPHQLAYYLRELANDFHTYYNAHTFLVDEEDSRYAVSASPAGCSCWWASASAWSA
jgi:arginyl-tRNA synthetase